MELATKGQGLAFVPPFAASHTIAAGQLVHLLPQWPAEESPLSAVYLEGRVLPRKIRALIDFAAEDLRASGLL